MSMKNRGSGGGSGPSLLPSYSLVESGFDSSTKLQDPSERGPMLANFAFPIAIRIQPICIKFIHHLFIPNYLNQQTHTSWTDKFLIPHTFVYLSSHPSFVVLLGEKL